MQVAILTGGLATRLRPMTEKIPKSMIDIHGRPFLDYQFEMLKKNGITDVVLCIAYLGEMIESHFGNGKDSGISIKYSYEKDGLLGTAGALKNAEELLEDVFFILYGDCYLFLDFSKVMSCFKSENKRALMTVYQNYDQYDRSNTAVKDGLVTKYNKTVKDEDMVYIDYGVSILSKKTLELIPLNRAYSLGEVFRELIERRELLAYEVKERFYQVGSLLGIEEFKEYITGSRLKE